jgi:hypothetical protein
MVTQNSECDWMRILLAIDVKRLDAFNQRSEAKRKFQPSTNDRWSYIKQAGIAYTGVGVRVHVEIAEDIQINFARSFQIPLCSSTT